MSLFRSEYEISGFTKVTLQIAGFHPYTRCHKQGLFTELNRNLNATEKSVLLECEAVYHPRRSESSTTLPRILKPTLNYCSLLCLTVPLVRRVNTLKCGHLCANVRRVRKLSWPILWHYSTAFPQKFNSATQEIGQYCRPLRREEDTGPHLYKARVIIRDVSRLKPRG